MLIVRFGLGDRAYGVRARDVREILPLCRARPVPGAPVFVLGEFLLGGTRVPLIDLRRWLEGEFCRTDLATRMLLLDYKPGGACALAALISGAYQPAPGERVAVLVCGANPTEAPV